LREGALQYTNKFDLPEPLLGFARSKRYSKGEADISVTECIGPPRINYLWRVHDNDIRIDITEEAYSMMGSAFHLIVETGAREGQCEGYLSEERLFTEAAGWTISGAIDLQLLQRANSCHIIDYKTTFIVATAKIKPEWEAQLNIYAWLVRKVKGLNVEAATICAFLRDWRANAAKLEKNYPPASIITMPVKLWSQEECQEYVEERIRIHQDTRRAFDWGEEPPECTDDERWLRDHKWAVRREGGKRALRVWDTQEEAETYLLKRVKDGKAGDKFEIEERKGEPIRCTGNYCHVAKWCSQFKKLQEQANGNA
jgi:hypothetical protein